MKKIILTVCLAALFVSIKSQNDGSVVSQGDCGLIKYFYNNAGDRVLRMVVECDDNNPPVNKRDVNENSLIAKLEIVVVSPNPTVGLVTVDLNSTVENGTVTLTTSQGTMVFEKSFSGKSFPLDLTSLSAGSYIVNVKSGKESDSKMVIRRN